MAGREWQQAEEPLQLAEEVLRPKAQESKDLEERLLNALEEKVDLVVQDLKRSGGSPLGGSVWIFFGWIPWCTGGSTRESR